MVLSEILSLVFSLYAINTLKMTGLGGGGLEFSSPCYCLGLSWPNISKLQPFQVEHPYLKGQGAETFKILGCGGLEHLHRLPISISTLNVKNLRCSNIHPFLMLKMSRCHSLHLGCFEMRKPPSWFLQSHFQTAYRAWGFMHTGLHSSR